MSSPLKSIVVIFFIIRLLLILNGIINIKAFNVCYKYSRRAKSDDLS